MSSQPFIIDVNARTITTPPDFTNAGVKSDHNALRLYFEIGRTYDGEDLSTHSIAVPYINANGEKDIYGVTDIDLTTPDKIIFSWELSNHVTRYAGTVSFAIMFYSTQDNVYTYKYNTIGATLKISDGIVVGIGDVSTKPDILELIPNVPNWALQPTKPTYTAAEVGALPNTTFVATQFDITGEIKTQQLSNSLVYPFNSSSTSISLQNARNNINYTIQYEVTSITGGFVGDIVISEKTINGFKISYTGSATNITLKIYIKGGIY